MKKIQSFRLRFRRAGAPDRQEIVYCEECYQAEVV